MNDTFKVKWDCYLLLQLVKKKKNWFISFSFPHILTDEQLTQTYDKRGIFLKLDFFIRNPAGTAVLEYYFYFIKILKYFHFLWKPIFPLAPGRRIRLGSLEGKKRKEFILPRQKKYRRGAFWRWKSFGDPWILLSLTWIVLSCC